MGFVDLQGQVLCLSRLEETVRDAEFIFEAVVDDLQVKQDLFERKSVSSPLSVNWNNISRWNSSTKRRVGNTRCLAALNAENVLKCLRMRS